MSSLSVSLLGHLAVVWNQQPIPTFRSNRVPALLTYLAVEADRPLRREALMELLWPGLPAASARQNLRQTLYLLRQEIPELRAKSAEDTVPLLLSNRHTVQLNPDGDFFLDVAKMEQLVSGQPTADMLTEAVALYQGDFLADFYLPDSGNFEEWAAAKRAAYRRLVLEALAQLTAVHLQQANFTAAEQTARRQLEIDNLRESGHRQLMEVLARNGRRRAALSHYESLSQLLQAELDITPSPETQDLAQAIRDGGVVERREGRVERQEERVESVEVAIEHSPLPTSHSPFPNSTPRHNLPPQPTPFIGRLAELSALDSYLAAPDVRLVTIVGAGGMGKTRLALAVAERIIETEQFANGVFWINLAPLSEASQIVPAIADALNFPLQSVERSPQQQLLDYLRQKEMLLLFDNFEHLLDGTELLTEILQTAPKVKILVTSRERLHLRTERVYSIEGLAFPDWKTPENAEEYTAVQLFLQSARRNQPNFALHGKDDLTYLARICRMVAGMPLALELAASWVDTLPLSAIATELQQGLDLLETDLRDMPERHRSIRAAIDYSWQKLDGKEQDVFAKLSVFRGGFTREAARAVADANLRQLARLVSKSFLQSGAKDGRYQIHELLRQYGVEKLKESGGETAVCDQHCAYYCRHLYKHVDALESRPQEVITDIEADLINIETAWDWAIEYKQLDHLALAIDGLAKFYDLRYQHLRGLNTFQKAAEVLKVTSFTEEIKTQVVTAKSYLWQGVFAYSLGQNKQAKTILEKTTSRWQELMPHHLSAQAGQALTLRYLAAALLRDADYATAQQLGEQSLQIFRQLGDQQGVADTIIQVFASTYILQGMFTEGERLIRDALSIHQERGDSSGVWRATVFLRWSLMLSGNYAEIVELARSHGEAKFVEFAKLHQGLYDQASSNLKSYLARERQEGSLVSMAFSLTGLGMSSLAHSAYAEALQLFKESLIYAQQVQEDKLIAGALANMALAHHRLGHETEAQTCLLESLQRLTDSRTIEPLLVALPAAALLLADYRETERAVELYARAKQFRHVTNSSWFEDVIGQHIAQIEMSLSPDIAEAAQNRGQQLDVWQTAESLLTELQALGWGQSNSNET